MYASGTNLIAHRISGSFHWQLKMSKIGYASDTFVPSARVALMDTGTTRVLMPKEDWIQLYGMICENLPDGVQCIKNDSIYAL